MAFKAHCPISIPHTPAFLALAMFLSPRRRPGRPAVPPNGNGQIVGVDDRIDVRNVFHHLNMGKRNLSTVQVRFLSRDIGKAKGGCDKVTKSSSTNPGL